MIKVLATAGSDALDVIGALFFGIPIFFVMVAMVLMTFTKSDGVTTRRAGDCSIEQVTRASIIKVVTRSHGEESIVRKCSGSFLPGHWEARPNSAVDCVGNGP